MERKIRRKKLHWYVFFTANIQSVQHHSFYLKLFVHTHGDNTDRRRYRRADQLRWTAGEGAAVRLCSVSARSAKGRCGLPLGWQVNSWDHSFLWGHQGRRNDHTLSSRGRNRQVRFNSASIVQLKIKISPAVRILVFSLFRHSGRALDVFGTDIFSFQRQWSSKWMILLQKLS